ncbi:MAG: hypothetical protein OEW05_07600 [Candidatus Aminicenantes bacterium]|nr:hypothetical protein [Candidatus Aminicenantes bacterium]
MSRKTDEEGVGIKRCFELAHEALELMRTCNVRSVKPTSREYGQARAKFDEAQDNFKEALAVVKSLLGPVPVPAAPDEAERRRREEAARALVVSGRTLEELNLELSADPLVQAIMTRPEIEEALARTYPSQSVGNRKMANIKARILLDKLQAKLVEAADLEKEVKARTT